MLVAMSLLRPPTTDGGSSSLGFGYGVVAEMRSTATSVSGSSDSAGAEQERAQQEATLPDGRVALVFARAISVELFQAFHLIAGGVHNGLPRSGFLVKLALPLVGGTLFDEFGDGGEFVVATELFGKGFEQPGHAQ